MTRRLLPPAPTALCRIALAVIFAGVCTLFFAAHSATAGLDGRLLSVVDKMESSYSLIEDYTAIFRKRERIGKSRMIDETIFMKFQKPLKVYLKWINENKEALYVAGEYNNKVLVYSHYLFGMSTFSFNPDSPLLMLGNRHPITAIGFLFIIEIMRRDFTLADQFGEVEIVRMEDDVFEGRPSLLIEARFSPHDGRKYYTSRFICQIDKEFMMPVGITCYDEKGDLQEQYSYMDVKINPGLSADDFSRENVKKHFQP